LNSHIVIVGAGQAGLQAAETLRTGGFDGEITLLGDESHAPYHRPPLSKGWLAGTLNTEQLSMRAAAVLERKQIGLHTGARVASFDVATRSVALMDGSKLSYSGLVLATGATPRTIPCAASASALVRVLRSQDDANAIAAGLKACAENGLPVVIIGGGFIGLEVAATARLLGLCVTILEAGPRLLARVLAPAMSEWYAQLHLGHGAQVVLDAQVSGIEDAGSHAVEVCLTDGRSYLAGLVLVGIGVVPNDALARDAGLECASGIVIDACGRTSAADVVAAGDCAIRRLESGGLLRLESVQNAVEQGRAAAYTLLNQERPFVATPWFWSDQYDKKLQIAGLSGSADAWATRGDISSGAFSVYHFRADRLIAVDSINSMKDHLLARRLLGAGASPTLAQAAEVTFDLSTLISAE
jgi:3-phenylpropionate/trans-cinnamate dioxygenase ferredoxin reductase subunit